MEYIKITSKPTVTSSAPTTDNVFINQGNAVKQITVDNLVNNSTLSAKVGTTDISGIGNGTVTGAVSTINSNLGALSTNAGDPVSCPNAVWTWVGGITLNPGTYMITGKCNFPYSATSVNGDRRVMLEIPNADNSTPTPSLENLGSCSADNAKMAIIQDVNRFVLVAASTTFRLYALQNSGSAMDVSGRVRAMRIK